MSFPEPGGPDPARFAGASLRLLLCRLSTCAQVLPSVTHRVLLWTSRAVPGVYADVAYRPPDEPRGRDGVAGWVAAGCGMPARRFDVLGITLTVPQEALNLPRLLRDSGVPLGCAARDADPGSPFVLLGGHSAAVAPFLHGPVPGPTGDAGAGLVDAVVIGDGVTALREALAVLAEARTHDVPRPDLRRLLAARVPGLYVPSLYEHVHDGGRLETIRPLDPAAPLPVPRRSEPFEAWRGYDGAFIPWSDEPGEETLPVAMGCPHRCRFCRDGWASGPHRQADPDLALAIATDMKAALAATDLNLLSSDLGCQRDLLGLLERLLRLYPRLSAKSLAGISLVRSPLLAALLPRLGKRELTVGVEGASARLRRHLGKRFDPWTLPGLLGPMAREGLRQAKLFFIATGLERDADLEELGRLLAAIRREAPRLRLVVSLMPFFPAPGTPLGLSPLRNTENVLRRMEEMIRNAGAEPRDSASAQEIRAIALLTRAGRRATPALVRASIERHIVYDTELRAHDAAAIERLLVESGVALPPLEAELDGDAPCPWDDIDLGTPRRMLHEEYERAVEALDAADAPPEPGAAPETILRVGRLRELPDPFAERRRGGFLFRVEPGAADRPGLTLARGALREWFLDDGAAARAFAGLDPPLGLPGTSGLRVAAVEFAADHRPRLPDGLADAPPRPGRSRPAVPVALLPAVPRRPWFLGRTDAGRFEELRRNLAERQPAVRHRVERYGSGRRIVVDKGFWNRCGLAAAHADADGLHLFLSPAAETLVRQLATGGSPVTCVALFDADPPRKCTVCRSPVLHVVCGVAGESICPICRAAPGAAGPR